MDDQHPPSASADIASVSAGEAAPASPQESPQQEPLVRAEAPPPDLESRIVEALKSIYDPEIPVNIYELGLIYDVDVRGDHTVGIRMTLTSPACPVAGTLPGEVEMKVAGVDGVDACEVDLVWDPEWNPEMMSEAAQLELGFF